MKEEKRKTRIVTVQLAMWVREVTTVHVEVPAEMTDRQVKDSLREIYDQHDAGMTEWEDDFTWGCEEGTHAFLGEAPSGATPDMSFGLDDDDDDDDDEGPDMLLGANYEEETAG